MRWENKLYQVSTCIIIYSKPVAFAQGYNNKCEESESLEGAQRKYGNIINNEVGLHISGEMCTVP